MRQINYNKFLIDKNYTLSEIRNIVGNPGRGGKWVKGYLEHNNEMFIFANTDGGGFIGHDYKNFWIKENKILDWKGDKQSSINDKYIKYILSGDYPIHLFTRENKYKPGTPYIYRGKAIPARIISNEPVNIILDLEIETSYIDLDEHIVADNEPIVYEELFNKLERVVPKRSSNLREKVLKVNNYKCEVDPSHSTFISNSTNEQYMETHHIIPISAQSYFKDVKLDTISNIACLCPNCHRLIHFGTKEAKLGILEFLYKNHVRSMREANLPIDGLQDLIIYYNN